jgi:molybdate transport system substrate-binding protein
MFWKLIHYETLLILTALGCLGCGGSPANSGGETVYCLAATSTRDALEDIRTAFQKETGVQVQLSTDDSSRLAVQIVQGAPADIFLSANQQWADHIKEKGLAGLVTPLLGNRLILIVPAANNPAGLATAADLGKPEVKRVAVAGPTVPAGIYARQALRSLGLWDKLERQQKIVTGDTVRVVLAYVERGEVEAGILYATDGQISSKVKTVQEFPADTHDPIIYPLVLLKEGEKKGAARRFVEYLQSPAAGTVFRQHGFQFLPGS